MGSVESEYMAEPPEGQGRFDAGTITAGAMALGGVLVSISIIFVTLRVFTRLHIVKRPLGPEDYCIGLSLALAIAFFGLSIKLCQLGVGVHLWQVKRIDYSPPFLLHSVAVIVVYSLSVTTAKMSLLILYLRLSPDRAFRIVVVSFIAFTAAYALAYLFVIVFSCRPIEASWDVTTRSGATCIDKNTVYLVLSATNIAMDIVCLVLPLKIIMPLQMPNRQKWSLIALFATGFFVCFCAIRRTVLLPPLFRSTDFTRDVEKQLNWACVEVNAGIICASVPALKPFFVRYLPMVVSSRITGSTKKSNHNYQTSVPYSTTVENNKKRRNVQSEAYELHSHDELSLSSSNEMPKNGSREDVAQLWTGNAFRNDPTGHRQTIIESKPKDSDASSVDTVGEIAPVAGGSHGAGLRPPARMSSVRASGGITVTTETMVVYERSS
ncbi:Satratoxin biosynthesis SC1 cluster protein 4 [Colletotrichum spinosum]|uniref:Satratoxin biosynthesis SC1 cluster protein 4 n=1 Tax=Colletotrichum spinosum TaxID=1347390 RepID=A0A4R8PU78_9PEZI|nr:Satratoxin biosynthesis SC1 cluster protein 4 [Colletotrichum spinosum]